MQSSVKVQAPAQPASATQAESRRVLQEWIENLLARRGWTPQQLGKLADVDATTIYRIRNAAHSASIACCELCHSSRRADARISIAGDPKAHRHLKGAQMRDEAEHYLA